MLATESGANRVQVEFLARPIQHMPHLDANGSCSPEFLNPIPRDELMEESGLFALQMDDPFANMNAQHHHTNQIQIQVSSSRQHRNTLHFTFWVRGQRTKRSAAN